MSLPPHFHILLLSFSIASRPSNFFWRETLCCYIWLLSRRNGSSSQAVLVLGLLSSLQLLLLKPRESQQAPALLMIMTTFGMWQKSSSRLSMEEEMKGKELTSYNSIVHLQFNAAINDFYTYILCKSYPRAGLLWKVVACSSTHFIFTVKLGEAKVWLGFCSTQHLSINCDQSTQCFDLHCSTESPTNCDPYGP